MFWVPNAAPADHAAPVTDLPFDRLDELAAHLPFAVDDYGAAAAAFVRSREGRGRGGAAERETVELWVYCYALRYLYVRFARDPVATATDLDAVIDRTFVRALERLSTIRDPLKLPHFVSVACRNGLATYRERRRPTVALDEDRDAAPMPPRPCDFDGQLVRHEVARAVRALPPALRAVARMRLLDAAEYGDIADATGHPLPTVRTYLSKALRKLRKDAGLRALAPEVLDREAEALEAGGGAG